jgi:carbonic anhydrase
LAEHTVGRLRHPMELHAVFRAANGKLLVVAQLFRLGRENAFLARFDDLLPDREDEEVGASTELSLSEALRDPASYTYRLTTPPCSPIVTWVVLKRPATMSPAQLERRFWRIMGNNFRPTQPRNGRTIRATAR